MRSSPDGLDGTQLHTVLSSVKSKNWKFTSAHGVCEVGVSGRGERDGRVYQGSWSMHRQQSRQKTIRVPPALRVGYQ
nr:hypothetical protein [Pseudomonas sp. LB-090624]